MCIRDRLWAAAQYGAQVRAYFVKTPFQPAFELRDAQRLAGELSMPLTVIEFDVLSVPGAAENGPERCYHCKRALFTRLIEAARADGFSLLQMCIRDRLSPSGGTEAAGAAQGSAPRA